MADIKPSTNPFIRAADELRATGKIERKTEVSTSRRVARALLNYFPEDSELLPMIDRALQALSRGIYWDRGSILNVLV
jgi:hypothetical protein